MSNQYGGQVVLDHIDTETLQHELQKRKQIDSNIVTSSTTNPRSLIKNEAYVVISEEPKQQGLRFRYKCEGRSAGSIPGERSNSEKKTYPAIEIRNFDGPAAIVVVSCVTKDEPYQPHPHNLVGPDCRDGVCTIKVKGNHVVTFPNVGIQCCKRHDVEESLKCREKIRVDPFGKGYPTANSINNLDLNAVRLCFQVFLPDAQKKFTVIVPPVVSRPIIDKKSIHDLIICRLSRNTGFVNGGDEVFLLCEKINKDDIQVRFFQEQPDGSMWEALGNFNSNDVHRQFAIVFRTPQYMNLYITEPTNVYIQLKRPSDDEYGDPKPFTYIPLERDPYGLQQKKIRRDMSTSLANVNTITQIPMHVQQEAETDYEPTSSVSIDVKCRLKRKAERGLSLREVDTKPTISYIDQIEAASKIVSPGQKIFPNNIILLNEDQYRYLQRGSNIGMDETQGASNQIVNSLNEDQFLNDSNIVNSVGPGGFSYIASNDLNVGAHEFIGHMELSKEHQRK